MDIEKSKFTSKIKSFRGGDRNLNEMRMFEVAITSEVVNNRYFT